MDRESEQPLTVALDQNEETTNIITTGEPVQQQATDSMDRESEQPLTVALDQNEETTNIITTGEPVQQQATDSIAEEAPQPSTIAVEQDQETKKITAIAQPVEQAKVDQSTKVMATVAPAAEPSAKAGEIPSPHPLLVRAVGATRPVAAFVHSHPALTTAAGVGVGLCVLPLVLLTSPVILSTAATYKLLCPTRIKDTLHHYSTKLSDEIRRAAQTV
ncbi:hypothetical protein SpCBS45565_g08332 [Spizellomyces sp. 'palustris']|nr:hypothetical protein SpCBS45565_g08332 [Spizellomyces sp. 'palustris']